jgi:hypothetical protein
VSTAFCLGVLEFGLTHFWNLEGSFGLGDVLFFSFDLVTLSDLSDLLDVFDLIDRSEPLLEVLNL